ncbi:EAL domain-containing protein [Amphritea sp. HPY]|uniref:EAL domain-containing protein n=1 Tax=Amphritea sp. HPY TaxID=3421652 RepID=UPI003D7D6E0A
MLLKRLNSLKLKLLIILAPGATLALMLAFSYTFVQAEKQFTSDLEAKKNNLKNYADIIAGPLWNFNTERVEKIANTMMLDPDLLLVEVLDEGGNIRLHKQSDYQGEGRSIELAFPIVYSNAHITQQAGTLKLQLGETSLNTEKDRFLNTAIISLLLIYLAMLFSVWLIFTYLLDSPIKKLMDAITNYHSAHKFNRIEHSSTDELGRITAAFNEMHERLESHHSQLEQSKVHLQNLYHSTPSLLFSFDKSGHIRDASNYFLEQMGYQREEVIGFNLCDLLFEPENKASILDTLQQLWTELHLTDQPLQIINGAGEKMEVLMDATLSANDAYPGALAVISDVTSLNQARKKLEHQANTDFLSGIANRYHFQKYLEQLITERQNSKTPFALMFIDLDHFKSVNDTFGHNTGDELICQATQRIQSILRPDDKIARLGGDEFAVIIHDISDDNEAENIATRIIATTQQSFYLQQSDIYISASIGIALYPGDNEQPTGLLQSADLAMYRAKDEGRSCFAFYTPQHNEVIQKRMRIENLLRHAIKNDALVLHYQPIIDLHSKKIVGMEALLRLQDGDELIPPDQFIPIAEESGLIISIGEWCLRQSCEQLVEWHQQLDPELYISINVSTRQFQSKTFMAVISQMLEDYHLTADKVLIEITESLLLHDNQHNMNVFKRLNHLGFRIAIDDFGTGYSALSYLMKFPINVLKIDRSFVHQIAADDDGQENSLIKAIIQMSQGMNLKVIAEGVETPGQLALLQNLSNDICVQGYLFAKPVCASEFTRNFTHISGSSECRSVNKICEETD